MSNLILLALLQAIIQIWLLPLILNLRHIKYLLSNRDNKIQGSALTQRVHRASVNFQESLPAFLVLCILSILSTVDNTQLASYWIISRIGYLLSYTFGIIYVRTLFWIASIICLILMAVKLIT